MNQNLKLAVYCRVSSDEQKAGGNIHRQIEQAPVEIERLGLLADISSSRLVSRREGLLPDDRYFIDEAYNLEELKPGTAFGELLERIQAGEINGLYVDSVDRIFRSRSHAVRGTIADIIEQNEIKIITPTGEIQTGLMLQFMSAIGAEDKKQTLRKLHIGKKHKVKNHGRPPNGRAFWGYHFDKTANKWSVVENEAQVVRWVAAMSAGKTTKDMPEVFKILVSEHTSGVSDAVILEALNLHGVNMKSYLERSNLRVAMTRNPNGVLPRNWLCNLYRDDRYTGLHEYRLKPTNHVGKKHSKESEREVIQVKIPSIISEEDWELAKVTRTSRSCVTPRHGTQDYLLQGIASCAHCNRKMGARARHNDYYRVRKKTVERDVATYYTCQIKNSANGIKCQPSKYHQSKRIDSLVWERVVGYINSDVLQKIYAKAASTEHFSLELGQLQKEIQELDEKIKNLSTERSRYLEMLEKNHITELDWADQRARIEKVAKDYDK